jgi:hypothetical protein
MIETIRGSRYTIKQIFKDGWDDFLSKHNGTIRPAVLENVAKILSCGDTNILGYNLYVCPECGGKKIVPHTCKSRFCNSCGKIKNDEWVEKAQTRLFNISHKHLVFSVPEEIRPLFMKNRHLLSLLHRAAGQAISDWAETVNFLPGIVSVLHTFGAKLNFNCHIHVLCSLGGVDLKNYKFKEYKFIAIESVKSRFKTILLGMLRQEYAAEKIKIDSDIKKVWLKTYHTTVFFEVQNKLWEKEWYAWVGEELSNASHSVAYVGRYAKRPCLSEAKITEYDQDNKLVRFSYKDKISKEEKEMEVSREEFINLLVKHIPDKYFNMIRYYGMYSNVKKEKVLTILAKWLIYLYGRVYLLFEPNVLTWRERIKDIAGKDPLLCRRCQKEMELTEIVYRIRDGTWKMVYVS